MNLPRCSHRGDCFPCRRQYNQINSPGCDQIDQEESIKRAANVLNLAVAWIALFGFCSACASRLPEIVHHDPPEMPAVDLGPFLADGCQIDSAGYLTCPEGSPLTELECTYLQSPDALLGSLQPAYPLVECQLGYDRYKPDSTTYLFEKGCLDHRWVQYAVYREGNYQILPALADFQSLFAPVESSTEALSYALAVTGLQARFDLETSLDYKYEVDRIEETRVEETEDGYRINLFSYSVCGCGPHYFRQITVNVSRDGQTALSPPVNLFRDPELDKVCGD